MSKLTIQELKKIINIEVRNLLKEKTTLNEGQCSCGYTKSDGTTGTFAVQVPSQCSAGCNEQCCNAMGGYALGITQDGGGRGKGKGINKHDFHASKRASSLKEAQKCKSAKDCAPGCFCHQGNCTNSSGGACYGDWRPRPKNEVSYKRPKNEVLKEAREAVRKNGGCGCGKKR